ncbi:MAG TPA: amidohydrolase family protein [Bacteroidales bacterium]|nr:amidohydrolase family protein [Bacteroidales bacterium]
MRRFASQYIITNTGPVLRQSIVTTTDDGLITDIEDTGGSLKESSSIEYYNGIIIPGLVNCHCHLELSYMKGLIPRGKGLGDFIGQLSNLRNQNAEKAVSAAFSSDNSMYRNGISLCADVCNTSVTFPLKRNSRISYFNFIEVFGIDPENSTRRIEEAKIVIEEAAKSGLEYSIVPHSPYSVSLPLFSLIKDLSGQNNVTSIHFMETESEKELLENHTGTLLELYRRAGLLKSKPLTAKNHSDVILDAVTQSGNLILVHNTYVDRATIENVKRRRSLYWCLCPDSNLYIEKKLPPVKMLMDEGCKIVIGTDSLASNNRLDVFGEIRTLQLNFPELPLADLVEWATINGARALCKEKDYGTIEPGKSPGLALIENADLKNLKLTEDSTITRLI